MIFITGFARGGTSWLRNCIAFHPEVQKIPHEMTIFRDLKSKEEIESAVEKAVNENQLSKTYIVNKAPANSPYVGKACRMFPESKFIFIIRTPEMFLFHTNAVQRNGWEVPTVQ